MILDSEAHRQAEINKAEGMRTSAILKAEGEAAAILTRSRATAESLAVVSKSINLEGGSDAVSMRIAEQYVEAFGNLAQKGTTLMLPSNASDPAAMVAQAMSIFNRLSPGAANAVPSLGQSPSSGVPKVPPTAAPVSSPDDSFGDDRFPDDTAKADRQP